MKLKQYLQLACSLTIFFSFCNAAWESVLTSLLKFISTQFWPLDFLSKKILFTLSWNEIIYPGAFHQLIPCVQKMNRILTSQTAEAWNFSSHFSVVTMQVQLYWVMNTVLSFILNMKTEAQYPPYILYRMVFLLYCWGKLCFRSQLHVYLPKKWCYFYTEYWRWKSFFLSCGTNYPVSVVLWNIQISLSNKPNV